MASLLFPFFHVSLLFGGIYYVARKPLQEFVRNRHETLKKNIEGVRIQLKDAKSRYEELDAKLKGMDAELTSLKANVQADASAIRDQVIASAKTSSASLVSDARQSAEALNKSLQSEVKMKFVDEVMALVEKKIQSQLTGEVKKKFAKEFSSRLA